MMSFNRGKIKVEPNATITKKAPTKIEGQTLRVGRNGSWDSSQWLGTSQSPTIPYRGVMNNDLNMNTMNVPEGYHMMPDGTIMPNNQMNCGGVPHVPLRKQFGGDSKAPQNMTIDGIGQARTDLMKNYLSANMFGSLLDQEAAMLASQSQNRFDNGGSVYNQNMYGQDNYAGAIDVTRKQLKKDWRNFGNAFENVVNSYPQQQSIQQPIQPMGKVQSKQVNFNQQDPSLAIPDGGFTGVDAYMAYGGNMPMMVNGGEDSGWQPGQPWNPLFDALGYNQAEEEAKWRAKLASGAHTFAPNTIPNQVDPSGGIGAAAGASNVRVVPNQPSPLRQDPTRSDMPTIQLSDAELKGVKTEEDYWKAVSAKTNQQNKPVSAGIKKRAAESIVGKTPAERKEIETAKAEVARATVNTNRGNVNDDGQPSVITSESYGANQGNQNQVLVPGYGGGRMKIKGVDPATGKRFKIKYDTAYNPRTMYGGRGPRVVKYDIYNNPVYQQQSAEAAEVANEVAPYEFNNINASINTPNFNPRFPQNQGAFGQGQQAWYSPTELGDLTAPTPSYFTEADYMNANANEPYYNPNDYMNAPGIGDQMQNFRPRQAEQVQGETTPANLNQRFMQQVDQDFRRGFNYGGDVNIYPTFDNGGAFNNQGSAALGSDAYATGPESGSYIDENGALVTYGDEQRPDMKAKLKGNNQSFNQWAPMILPGLDMVSSIAEQGDARRNEAQLQNLKQASNVFTPNTIRNKGKNTVNQGYFDPYDMTPVQFAGNDQGAIGSPNVYSKYGGQPMYPDGGDVKMPQDNTRTNQVMVPQQIKDGNIQQMIDATNRYNEQVANLQSPYTTIAMPDYNTAWAGDSIRFFPGQRGNFGVPYVRDGIGTKGFADQYGSKDYLDMVNYNGARMYQDTSRVRANHDIMYNEPAPVREYQDGGEYELTEQEIAQILAMGGQIEYL